MKYLTLIIIGVMLGYGWSFMANKDQLQGLTKDQYINDTVINMQALGFELVGVPTDQVHTMRVWEDGSYNIEYKDGTSERGCLTNGLCQD